jgi:L-alanine-DL-glutamate epimerase-like enolase superfamily enzyme
LRNALPIAIAMGEHIFSKHAFLPYVVEGAVDVLQPDACLIGGITEALEAGRLADMHGRATAPHFMTELNVHLAAALPRAGYVEFYPFMDELLVERLELDRGEVLVPQRPGHGVSFTAEAWRRYRVA